MTLPQLFAKHDRETATLLRAALREHDGNTSRTAAALDVPRTTLLRLIERLGLEKETSGKEGRPRD